MIHLAIRSPPYLIFIQMFLPKVSFLTEEATFFFHSTLIFIISLVSGNELIECTGGEREISEFIFMQLKIYNLM